MFQIKRKSFQTIEMSFSENRHICGFSCKIIKKAAKNYPPPQPMLILLSFQDITFTILSSKTSGIFYYAKVFGISEILVEK